jgi:hypothetical protein
MKEEIEQIKTKKDLVKNIFVDCAVGIFLVAGLWTITHGVLMVYSSFYKATFDIVNRLNCSSDKNG